MRPISLEVYDVMNLDHQYETVYDVLSLSSSGITVTGGPSYPDLDNGVTIHPDFLNDGLLEEVKRHRSGGVVSERHQATPASPGCRADTHTFFTLRGEDSLGSSSPDVVEDVLVLGEPTLFFCISPSARTKSPFWRKSSPIPTKPVRRS